MVGNSIESNGKPGHITVSGEFRSVLEENFKARFVFEHHKAIDVVGRHHDVYLFEDQEKQQVEEAVDVGRTVQFRDRLRTMNTLTDGDEKDEPRKHRKSTAGATSTKDAVMAGLSKIASTFTGSKPERDRRSFNHLSTAPLGGSESGNGSTASSGRTKPPRRAFSSS